VTQSGREGVNDFVGDDPPERDAEIAPCAYGEIMR